jgi:DNA-binding NarL/FixJ family response regulator
LKVLVVVDQPMVVVAFCQLLKSIAPDTQATVYAGVAEVLSDLPNHGEADLVILSSDCGSAECEATIQSIHAQLPVTPVVLYSDQLSKEFVGNALRCGAAGVIPKHASYDVILNALKLILAGDLYVPAGRHAMASSFAPAYADITAKQSTTPAPSADERLSERESEVLSLVVAGLSNKAIASRLKIAESTVKVHVSRILRLFNVNSRTQISYQVMSERSAA